jgi:hypothetical protein
MPATHRPEYLAMKWICALLVLAVSLSAEGADRRRISPLFRRHISSQQHEGFSPFPPPAADDTLFIVDTGSGLDTDCTYRTGGPFIIHLAVTRYVGPVSGDNTLIEQSRLKLIAGGYLSKTAHLRLPAYDVDVHGDPSDPDVPPEVDRITFNGHTLPNPVSGANTLTGDNDIWKLNEFVVPIEWVRFPSMGSDGIPPIPADNVIKIDIDTASVGDQNWCTAVDWAELDFGAIAPIFLVHGIFSTGLKAWPEFHAAFDDAGIPFSDEIDLSQTGSIDGNASILDGRLRSLATKFGAKKCHVVAHSKGGLDTRSYLNGAYDADELKVLSLYTLSTPHHGTVLADIGIGLAAGTLGAQETALLLQSYPFLANLSTVSTAIFNFFHGTVPSGIQVHCYGADADANGDRSINAAEAAQLVLTSDPISLAGATVFYNIVGNEAPVKVTLGTQTVHLWGDVSFSTIDIDVSLNFRKNDILVSTVSAAAPFGTYAGTVVGNHTTIKSRDLAAVILRQIVTDYPNR